MALPSPYNILHTRRVAMFSFYTYMCCHVVRDFVQSGPVCLVKVTYRSSLLCMWHV